MIIVGCQGGLGNQMFQYACGKALARRRGETLRIDLSHYERRRERAFELDRFRVQYTRATLSERGRFRYLGLRSRLLSWPWRAGRLQDHRTVWETDGMHGLPNVDVAKHLYLEGYWQSPNYFRGIEKELQADFRLREPLQGWSAALAERMRVEESVAIHVRRGDYASDPCAQELLGTCPQDYYREAVRFLGARLKAPHWYVFSDDHAWVQSEFRPGTDCTLVVEGEGMSWVDLALMSVCRHHIIANSTFSWWGAWLGKRNNSIVVAPRRWFANGQAAAGDLYPAGWVAL